MEAKLAESLEQSKKAERFSLLEPPVIPEKPIKPNRKKITAMGLVLAVAGSGGLVMLLESIDKRIRGSLALTALLRQRPLVVVPYITTQEELARKKYWTKIIIAASVAVFFMAMLAVHLLYMPLDLLMLKIVARLGG